MGLGVLLLALAIAPAALAGPPTRGNHLLPEDPLYSKLEAVCSTKCSWQLEYETDVLSVLRKIFSEPVFARVVVMSSYQNEYAVGLAEDAGAFKIVHIRSKSRIWTYQLIQLYEAGKIRVFPNGSAQHDAEATRKDLEELRASVPASVSQVETERCERPVSSALGKRIAGIWRTMLERTRHPDGYLRPKRNELIAGLDGISYHFSYDGEWARHAAGQIWSPPENSEAGRLTAVSDLMVKYCEAGDAETLRSLDRQVDALHRQLRM